MYVCVCVCVCVRACLFVCDNVAIDLTHYLLLQNW